MGAGWCDRDWCQQAAAVPVQLSFMVHQSIVLTLVAQLQQRRGPVQRRLLPAHTCLNINHFVDLPTCIAKLQVLNVHVSAEAANITCLS